MRRLTQGDSGHRQAKSQRNLEKDKNKKKRKKTSLSVRGILQNACEEEEAEEEKEAKATRGY